MQQGAAGWVSLPLSGPLKCPFAWSLRRTHPYGQGTQLQFRSKLGAQMRNSPAEGDHQNPRDVHGSPEPGAQ